MTSDTRDHRLPRLASAPGPGSVSDHLDSDSTVPTPVGLVRASRRGALLGLTAGLLAACGGGGDTVVGDSGGLGDPGAGGAAGSPGGGSNNGTSDPGTPQAGGGGAVPDEPVLPIAAPTTKSAARFLGQAAMGANDAEIASVLELGYAGWIDQQMSTPGNRSRWDWLAWHGYSAEPNRMNQNGSDEAMWYKLFTSPDTLRQRVTQALSEIFVINGESLIGVADFRMTGNGWFMDMLESHAFGNYRVLLEEITLSHQMGTYLSMRDSKRENGTGRAPDENYAREILQLFSIGLYELNLDGSIRYAANGRALETYDNADVVGLSRVFTGWSANNVVEAPERWRTRMVFNPADHESGEKSFLGITIAPGTDGPTSLRIALDRIANHPNVGPFLSRQLIQRLVTSNPSRSYVARVAAVFNDNGQGVRGDLGAVIKAILLDSAARNQATDHPYAGKVREPIIRLAQWARSFKAGSANDSNYIGDLSDPATRLGQSPQRSPSVFNFFRPGFTPPNTRLGELGLVAPEMQIESEVAVIGYVNFMADVINEGIGGVLPDYSAEIAIADDAAALVGRIDLLLSAGQLSQANRNLMINAIDAMPAGNAEDLRLRVCAAILMVMTCPEYLIQK